MKTSYFEIDSDLGKIWCAYDYIDSEDEKKPLVIIAPGFERTARDSITLSSYFLLNGFRVLRFDSRNSCGLSVGCFEDYSLSSLTEDMDIVVDYASNYLSHNQPLSIVAISLSSRALLKYLSKDTQSTKKVKMAVSLVGVVDVKHTIAQITEENPFEGILNGEKYGVRKLLTYNLNWDKCFTDAIQNGFLDVETSIEDAKKIKIEFLGTIITSEDEWILAEHQKRVYDAITNTIVDKFIIEGASHKIWKNPRSAEIAIKSCISLITKHILGNETRIDNVLKPEITDVIARNRIERKVILDWEDKYKGADYICKEALL